MNSTDLLKAVAVDAQASFQRQNVPTVTVPVEIPLHEIDFTACDISREYDPFEGWIYEVDLTGAVWMTTPIDVGELSEDARETLEERAIRDYNEGPEAA